MPHGLSDLYIEDVTHKHPFSEATWENIFANPYYDTSDSMEGRRASGERPFEWRLEVRANFIMGVVWRNLALFTQMVRV